MDSYLENRDPNATFDMDKDHEIAEKVAEGCIVLLKNDDNVLPLKKGSKVAYIGKFAKAPRYQGGGSSHIIGLPTHLMSLKNTLKSHMHKATTLNKISSMRH
jgi:beta-glucosidase-like glycosyl hydrolase